MKKNKNLIYGFLLVVLCLITSCSSSKKYDLADSTFNLDSNKEVVFSENDNTYNSYKNLYYVYPTKGDSTGSSRFEIIKKSSFYYVHEKYYVFFDKKEDANLMVGDSVLLYFDFMPQNTETLNLSIKPVKEDDDTSNTMLGISGEINIYNDSNLFGVLSYYTSENYSITLEYMENYIKDNIMPLSSSGNYISLSNNVVKETDSFLLANTKECSGSTIENATLEEKIQFIEKNDRLFNDLYSYGVSYFYDEKLGYDVSLSDKANASYYAIYEIKVMSDTIDLEKITLSDAIYSNDCYNIDIYYSSQRVGEVRVHSKFDNISFESVILQSLKTNSYSV